MNDSNLDSTKELHSYFQAKRLIQIYWAVELTLVLVIIQSLYEKRFENAFIVLLAFISIFGVYKLAKQNKVLAGSTLLLTIITVAVTYFLWTSAGIHDVAILAYPCILIMASMLGNKILFRSLLAFISFSIILNGITNQQQWYVNKVNPVTFDSAISVLLITLLISYSIWVMSADFRALLKKLSHENKQVLDSKVEIENLLHRDVLTGLPNRVMSKELFKKSVEKTKRDNLKVSLMFIDLDSFKLINDGLGHQAGDELLKELSNRLKKAVRSIDSVCRFSGDEFVIIFESVEDHQFLVRIAEDIITTVKAPFHYQSNEFICGCSIGITVSPHDGLDFDALVKKADTAMYHSKSNGGNSFNFFDPAMDVDGHHYLNVVTDLRKALKEKQFILYYQPKLDLTTNKIIGAEALIRWLHPDKGLIFPDFFIPQAEKSGLIVDIGEWVLDEACKTCQTWIEHGYTEFSIAVNVSSKQFKRGDLSKVVEASLAKSGLDAKHLEIEMTESLLIDNSDELKQTIRHLRSLGVSFSIDDFGTGYSNFGYLKEFEIESLKIDRSFVLDIDKNPKNKSLVTAIIQMAKSLGLTTIAEGIENKEIVTMLSDMQCDNAQGYYWSKPICEKDFMTFTQEFPNNMINNNVNNNVSNNINNGTIE